MWLAGCFLSCFLLFAKTLEFSSGRVSYSLDFAEWTPMMSQKMLVCPLCFLIAEYGNLPRVGFDIFDKTTSLANSPNISGLVRLTLLLAHRVCRLALLCSKLWVVFRSSLSVFTFQDSRWESRSYIVLAISLVGDRAQRGQSQPTHLVGGGLVCSYSSVHRQSPGEISSQWGRPGIIRVERK